MSVINLESAIEFYEMKPDLIDLIYRLSMAVPLSETSLEIIMEARAAIEQIESIGKKEGE